ETDGRFPVLRRLHYNQWKGVFPRGQEKKLRCGEVGACVGHMPDEVDNMLERCVRDLASLGRDLVRITSDPHEMNRAGAQLAHDPLGHFEEKIGSLSGFDRSAGTHDLRVLCYSQLLANDGAGVPRIGLQTIVEIGDKAVYHLDPGRGNAVLLDEVLLNR